MGQYYRGVILKKNHKLAKYPVIAALSPYKFDNGAKLMEHSYIGNTYVNAYVQLLSINGPFYGMPFAWAGDYANNIKGKSYYDNATNVEKETLEKYHDIVFMEKAYKFMLNFSKKKYVCIETYNPEKWQIHPLPLLTAIGNQLGNGDYYGINEDKVGMWAFDRIGFSDVIPNGFTKMEIYFEEV